MNNSYTYIDFPASTSINFAWNPTKIGLGIGATAGAVQGLPSQLDPTTGEIHNPGLKERTLNIAKNSLLGGGIGYGGNKLYQYMKSSNFDPIREQITQKSKGLRESVKSKVQPIINTFPEVHIEVTKKQPVIKNIDDPLEGINIPIYK